MNLIEKLNRQINRGRQAEQALQNETVKQAFEDVENSILESWKSCDPYDEKRLMLLKMEQSAIHHVKSQIAMYINKGKAAEKEITQKR